MQLGSNPWPGNSTCHEVANKGGKKLETVKFSEENTDEKLHYLELNNGFLEVTQKTQEKKEKNKKNEQQKNKILLLLNIQYKKYKGVPNVSQW